MRRICTICARGGSKGVKNKNLKLLLGKPLIAHSILQAKASELFDVIAVSSDSQEILQAAKDYGADIVIERPVELATDTAAKLPVIQHCVTEAEIKSGLVFDIMTDIDATSPLRSVEDLKDSIELLENHEHATNLITGAPSRRSPYFNLVEENTKGFVQLSKELSSAVVRRQDAPKSFDMNASIYIWKRDPFFDNTSLFTPNTVLYEMPEERSIDIDSELDFEFVSFLAEKRGSLL
ncbi:MULTISPECIES: acylneuraminate cytidylyltransferase family protein [unclassified Viridibacillus]|uniref:acylneuraminate cytidylyltransferase family protein n=1 Tax=unclassified Viridibacillus TaxID=2617942 RepID=UPI00096BD0D4|nr:acylneuraminate cytidylyltransferase family protein [Viridibacillus sp. FSL H8-0123]OMC81690.1 flagellar modification protein B [Viridibacillus sp. FSL H8-0123]